MSKTKSSENMLDQSPTIDRSTENTNDQLPWLIHSLLEKQATHSQTNPGSQATEPQKESQ